MHTSVLVHVSPRGPEADATCSALSLFTFESRSLYCIWSSSNQQVLETSLPISSPLQNQSYGHARGQGQFCCCLVGWFQFRLPCEIWVLRIPTQVLRPTRQELSPTEQSPEALNSFGSSRKSTYCPEVCSRTEKIAIFLMSRRVGRNATNVSVSEHCSVSHTVSGAVTEPANSCLCLEFQEAQSRVAATFREPWSQVSLCFILLFTYWL